MMTLTRPRDDRSYAEVDVQGKLTATDYEQLVPQLEQAIEQQDKLELLIRLNDFEGWTPGALVDDLRFDIRHRDDFDRIAVVGEKKLEELGTRLSAPFFSGEVRFFEDEDQAREWLN